MNSANSSSNAAPSTLRAVIACVAERAPESFALGAPGRQWLTYAALLAHIDRTGASLARAGIARNDSLAIVLPNGPEMATAFLSLASYATCAPLNPGYRAPEYEFYLSDLSAKALVILRGFDSPARDVAASLSIPVIDLVPTEGAEAGLFSLDVDQTDAAGDAEPGEANDVALILHTSGTTSRPKMVLLSHSNITTSGSNVSRTLRLTPDDRCLNVMPLFHIHGLIGALLSSMSAGASVVSTPGFLAPRFFEWIDECEPTWYSAVPTMHQAIVDRAGDNADVLKRHPFRLIRSSSAALAPKVMARMEEAFSCAVIESYGMTEAAHQMTSNPLPPEARKPGSVGIAAGPEVSIMDATGNRLPAGQTGEIVIRGANVTAGYANNPEANATAFTDGWFRTGDEGHFDEDSYLFISGRLKEIINRAGEKISPREIDEVLLDHPDIVQAVAFALPDERLGEDVAAAVICREGSELSELEVRNFAASRLADFKVPRKIVFLDEIPKGPTGKLQRIGLAEKLGLGAESGAATERAEYLAPRTPLEEKLTEIWSGELGVKRVGVRDDFFQLGGYSLLAVRIFNQIESTLGVRLPLTVLFEASTVEELALWVLGAASEQPFPPIVAIRREGAGTPLFFMANVDAFIFATLARLLDGNHPFYGLHPQGLAPPDSRQIDIPSLANAYVREIRAVQQEGPYILGGKCSSGTLAYEVAQQLAGKRQKVALLVLIDTPGPFGITDRMGLLVRRAGRVLKHGWHHLATIYRLPSAERTNYIRENLARLSARFSRDTAPAEDVQRGDLVQAYWNALKSARISYSPEPFDGRIVMFLTPAGSRPAGSGKAMRWKKLALRGASVYEIDAIHSEMLKEPHVSVIAEHLGRHLQEAERSIGAGGAPAAE